jgi:L-threonylcarbamoyladenylate synthase
VLADVDARIDAVLDGGACEIGLESTVLDLTAGPPIILRQGAVTWEQLQAALGEVSVNDFSALSGPQQGLPSPGMTSRHYAPRTKLRLADGRENTAAAVDQELRHGKVGVLLPSGWKVRADATFDWGDWGDWPTLASRLYAGLRWLDKQNLDLIIAPLPPREAVGGAIRERLLKAAGGS